jgi:hypothetical protein
MHPVGRIKEREARRIRRLSPSPFKGEGWDGGDQKNI